MVSFSSLALLSLAAVSSLAAPAKRGGCMTYEEATTVAEKYGELIAVYTDELADALLTPAFTDFSESVNTLINTCPQGDAAITLPLLAATFSSREQFEIGQGQQPPINFKQLQLWNTCSSVIIRWETTNTANITDVKPVIGLIVMETIPAPAGNQYPWVIDRVYSEFDSGAWLQNLQAAGICSDASKAPGPVGPAPVPSMSAPAPPASYSIEPAPVYTSPAPIQPMSSVQGWSATPSAPAPPASTPSAPAPPAYTPSSAWSSSSATPTAWYNSTSSTSTWTTSHSTTSLWTTSTSSSWASSSTSCDESSSTWAPSGYISAY